MSAPHIPTDLHTPGMNAAESSFFANAYNRTSTPTTQANAEQGGEAPPAEPDAGTATEPDQTQETPGDGQAGQEQQTAAETTTQDAVPTGDREAQLKYWMDKYAKDTRLDGLDQATQHKVLRMLAEKELEIQKQRSINQAAQDPAAHLTEFEKSQLNGTTDTQTAQTETAPKTEPGKTEPPRTATDQQVGANWRSYEDAQRDYGEAWKSGDLRRAGEIQQQMFWLQLADALPALEKFIDKRLQGQLGDVLPEVTNSAFEAKAKRAQDAALTDLGKLAGFEGIRDELFRKEDGFVEYDGQRWDNTPLNRVIAEHPEILDIQVQHDDPEVAARLTFTKRFRLAKAFIDQRKASPAATQKVLQAGIEAGKKETQQNFRQQLNRSSGAGSAPAQNSSYVQEIRAKSGLGTNLSSI